MSLAAGPWHLLGAGPNAHRCVSLPRNKLHRRHRRHRLGNCRLRAAQQQHHRSTASLDAAAQVPELGQQQRQSGWFGFVPFWSSTSSRDELDAPDSAQLLVQAVERVQEVSRTSISVFRSAAIRLDTRQPMHLQAAPRGPRLLSQAASRTAFVQLCMIASLTVRHCGTSLVLRLLHCCACIHGHLPDARAAHRILSYFAPAPAGLLLLSAAAVRSRRTTIANNCLAPT